MVAISIKEVRISNTLLRRLLPRLNVMASSAGWLHLSDVSLISRYIYYRSLVIIHHNMNMEGMPWIPIEYAGTTGTPVPQMDMLGLPRPLELAEPLVKSYQNMKMAGRP